MTDYEKRRQQALKQIEQELHADFLHGLFWRVLWLLLAVLLCARVVLADSAPEYYQGEYVFQLHGPGCLYPGKYPLARKCPRNGYAPGWHLATIYKGKVHVDNFRLPRAIQTDSKRLQIETKQLGNDQIEPNYVFRAFERGKQDTGEPNDTYFRKQWHHTVINSTQGWRSIDYPAVDTVAVVDTGVECNHPDLSCVPGFDATKNVKEWYGSDVNGHGTHCAGIVAAARNNGIGVAGIAPVAIMPIKVLSDSGSGSMFTVLKGIEYAKNKGVRIISLSLGASATVSGLADLIRDYIKDGGIVVAAAGNDATDLLLRPQYPCVHAGVVCVEATQQNGKRAYFSNFHSRPIPNGPHFVKAPGTDILSTYPGGKYTELSGTSMATPLVAGAIALTGRIPRAESHLDLAKLTGCHTKSCRKCIKDGGGVKKCNKKFNCTLNCKE